MGTKLICSTCLSTLKKSSPIQIGEGRWEIEFVCPKYNIENARDHAHITKIEDEFIEGDF